MGTAGSTRRIINADGTEKFIQSGLTESQKRKLAGKVPKPSGLQFPKDEETPVKKKPIKAKDFLRK